MKTFVLITSIFMISFSLEAQVQNSGWLASFNTLKLNNKFSLHAEVQVRSGDKFENIQTVILRPGINYHITKTLSASMGYGYVSGRRNIGSISGYLGEHRLWQQLTYNHKLKNISAAHRLRFEERYLPNASIINNELKRSGFSNAYRLRYFLRSIIPLNNKPAFAKGMFTALQNEIFINTGDGDAVNGKLFDQNRLYVAIGYRLSPKFDIETGYMNQYVSGRINDANNHIIQLAVYKRL